MNPILYPMDQKTFNSNGLGVLSDTISCKCTEALNGEYELDLEVFSDGIHVSEMYVNCILKVKPNYEDDPQPFRIYSIDQSIDGKVKVKAQHLTYDTSGIPILPCTSANLTEAVLNINTQHVLTEETNFTLTANFEADGEFKIEEPTPFRTLLGDGEKELLGVYGGDYHYDNYTIELLASRGVDKGICFRYKKNIIDFDQEINSENLYSAVFGYWKKSGSEGAEDTFVYGDIINIDNSLPYDRIFVLNTTDTIKKEGGADATKADVNSCVNDYIMNNMLGIPKYTMRIDYAEDDSIIKVCLGDIVGVLMPEYGIKSRARCRKVVFDCLLERNESIEIGNVTAGLAGDLANVV